MQIQGRNVALEDLRAKMMSDAVDATLAAWGRSIEEDKKRLAEEQQKLHRIADEDSRLQAQERAQQAMDAALDGKVASYLSSLLAASDPNSQIDIPEGFRAASGGVHAPSIPDFSALVAEIEAADKLDLSDDPVARSQASAAWAMGHGLMPHPADLSQIMRQTNIDPSFAGRLEELSGTLSKIEGKSFVHPQLKVAAGAERLDTLKQYVETLSGYGSARLVKLLSDPGSLLGFVEPALPAGSATSARRMPEKQFNAMLDNIFKR